MDGENDGALQGQEGATQDDSQAQAGAMKPIDNTGADDGGNGAAPPAPKAPNGGKPAEGQDGA